MNAEAACRMEHDISPQERNNLAMAIKKIAMHR